MTLEFSSLSIFIMIAIACVVVAHIVMNIIKYHGRKNFEKLANALAERSENARNEFESLFVPSRLVEERQIDDFKTKYADLLVDLENVKGHKYFDEEIFSDSGITLLLSALNDSTNLMQKNNEIYHAVEDLTNTAAQVTAQYQAYTHPTHYFAYSEMEGFLESSATVQEKISLVFPHYAEYVTDENAKNLPSLFKDIEKVRDEHNKHFVANELEQNRVYFDHVLGKYPLDPQQRDSIVKLEDNCLVIASAGSGKTSTIVSKAKYLVEKQHILPSRILLLTYTKKAANELLERMNIDGINSGTFHSLAYRIIGETTGQAPSICDADVPLNVFHKLIVENESFLHAIDNYIINLQSLMRLEHDYLDAFSYFEDRKKYGIQALFPDAEGKIIFTRSEEEKRLVSILTRLGIKFRYEHPYIYDTRTPERRQYTPDFTIYFKDDKDEWQRVFLEHYAIDENWQVPRWFGEGTRGGWRAANQRYLEGIEWKRATHQRYQTKLIETTSADFWNGTIEQKLREKLTACGVPIKERTDEELYNMMVQRNRQLEKTVFTLLLSFVTLMKANEKTIEGLLEESNQEDGKVPSVHQKRNQYILSEIVKPFFEAYEAEMAKTFEIDFTDAIIWATKICREGLWKQYDYILVDEFQDISIDRYKLLQALRSEKPKTKLYCVGDDWQSIFRFAGSDMALFYEFEKYFGYTEICKIETTYRFHQPLIDRSSEFVMKNREQKEKTIRTPEGDTKHTYLNFVKCESEENSVKEKVEEIVASLPKDEEILLMGRYNYDAMSVGFTGKIGANDNRIRVKIAGRELFFLSVHSAKGLEADHVILVNCNQGAYGFPSLIEDDPILDFVLSKSESYPFAEERRLFYVAMTRAKKRMYVLYDKQRPSPFISEFMLHLEVGSYICPKCLEGKIVSIKDGTTDTGVPYRSFVCSNREGGCDFFDTRYGDLTPPGILVTEDMTAQDVEQMRENRRRSRQSGIGLSQYTLQQPPTTGGRRYIPRTKYGH
jgi:DNA helicase-4